MKNTMRVISTAATTRIDLPSWLADQDLGQQTRSLIRGLAIGLCFSLLISGKAEAASFSFTKIADTNGSFFGFGDSDINDAGTVAFAAFTGPSIGDQAIFTSSNGTITQLTNTNDPFGNFYFGKSLDINNSGTVAFEADLNAGGQGIFTSSNGTITRLVDTNSSFSFFYDIALNDSGTLAFTATVGQDQGIFTISNGSITPIADTSGSLTGIADPAINNSGTVAFTGTLDKEGVTTFTNIFTNSNGIISPIIDANDLFFGATGAALNDNDTVAFRAGFLSNQNLGIFTSSNGVITKIADNSGTSLLKSFGKPLINNNGTVVFRGFSATGEVGIYTGSDSVADKIIASGDSLFGSTVLFTAVTGLNNLNQILFYAQLTDGTTGIYRADPISNPLTGIPEPSSVLSLLALGVVGIGSLHRRWRAQ
ncbi:choice-of-anchor tandem repeat NxxGxxAF-containing protein [Trichocoleus sp. FACHB-832]|jgi:hypothetical protein|uniref:DUF7453 family protein n=1 Tax=Trichocoleus sp. FACHB-832 TaxID=2692875 RepID=UPI001689C356|nr:choice-of-anchor tandem repeat NxxGxxAF-containing protein [Trichocoleus sp. FACHB-832]